MLFRLPVNKALIVVGSVVGLFLIYHAVHFDAHICYGNIGTRNMQCNVRHDTVEAQVNEQVLTGSSDKPDPFLTESGILRNCLSGSVYGKTPVDSYKTESLTLPDKTSEESSKMRKDSFKNVFDSHEWGVTASGGGSTLGYTHEVAATLHVVINHLKIALKKDRIKIVDIPCGDMVWMNRFLRSRDDVDYTGIDIVADLIKKHQTTYAQESWTFKNSDVVADGLPGSYDLIFSRMMMQHLQNNDVHKLLHMFSNSGSKYLLTTTFPATQSNVDLKLSARGRFHSTNFELPPWSLSPPLCMQYDGPRGPKNHVIALWNLPLKKLTECPKVNSFALSKTNLTYYSCLKWN